MLPNPQLVGGSRCRSPLGEHAVISSGTSVAKERTMTTRHLTTNDLQTRAGGPRRRNEALQTVPMQRRGHRSS